MSPPAHSRSGLTAVEVAVCVAIAGMLGALTLGAVQRARAAADRVGCQNRLRQVGLALHAHHDAHGRLPPAFSKTDHKYLGWLARLLPHLDRADLWAEADAAYAVLPVPWAAPHPLGRPVPTFACPADPVAGRPGTPANLTVGPGYPLATTVVGGSYLGVSGTDLDARDGVFWVNSNTRLADLTDGTAQTRAAGERPPPADLLYGWWYAGPGQERTGSADVVLGVHELNRGVPKCPPGWFQYGPGGPDDRCPLLHFWSHHPGGANFLAADAAVRFVGYAGGAVLPALATARGGDGGAWDQ